MESFSKGLMWSNLHFKKITLLEETRWKSLWPWVRQIFLKYNTQKLDPWKKILKNWTSLKLRISALWETLFRGLKTGHRASPVVQWLRICLSMHGTRVQALVREDPTCLGTTKPVRHNYWACPLEPVSHNYWAHVLQLLKPASLESMLCNKRSHCNEKPVHRNKE